MTTQQWLNSTETSINYKPFDPDGNISFGFVEFDAKNDIFRINMGFGYNGTYDMSADRILSGAGFLDFLFQVHSKEWVTAQHLADLLDCITCWTYREHGKFPQEFFDVICGMNKGLDEPNTL